MIASRSIKRVLVPALGASFACAALALLPARQPRRRHQPRPPASADRQPRERPVRPHRLGRQGQHRRRPSGFNINGYNWSGAAKTGSGFTSVKSSWTEPSVTCNSTNDLMAPWVGIDGYGSSSVEQTGVATDCSSGHPVYQAWYEMYPPTRSTTASAATRCRPATTSTPR